MKTSTRSLLPSPIMPGPFRQSPQNMMWFVLLFSFVFTACSNRGLYDWVYRKGIVRYRIGKVSSDWRKVEFTQNDISFYNHTYKALIQVNSTCRKDYEDTSLKILTDQILYGFRNRKFLTQEERKVGRRAALYTEVSATLDGVSIKSAILVVKKNECIYDFAYITRPWNFSRGISTFHRVVYGFKVFSS